MSLFETYKLNGLELRNRIVMAPMTTWSGNSDGTISEAELAYYKIRSEGCGMVITATTYLDPYGKGFKGQFYAGDDQMLPSLSKLASAIKSGGAKAILQVFHAGRKSSVEDMPDGNTRSASDVPGNRTGENVPVPMTKEEINSLLDSFYDATLRAQKAGFDGIEIHGANTYLIQQFFSPHANIRTDEWGGSLEKRARLPLAIVKATLKAKEDIGDDAFIVGYRFSPEENHTPGITLEDTEYLVNRLCETDLDYLHISLGDFRQESLRGEPVNVLNRVLEMIKNRKPLIGVGSVFCIEDAQALMEDGVDLVALGRQLLVDPKTVEKWSRGERANLYYRPDDEALMIPKALNDVIIRNHGWLPMEDEESPV
ncbi:MULTISPECIES: NADH-dependent flavin oxidoreductase [unclassified Fusibacter]|uniref:NADH-dependent flavin oxidoreductase n=1 Tax=unclassified Fusibacter TaxID=2624464 RepID=UPI00101124EC|nr:MULTISPECIES: NADH-dependent flavin oxidoreductase [unclassified Fusibacter]MCK8058134.1 NADH-dependent flavin oxidoreductase [Fusibacter sp. A2]NPE20716.1 NADH-dependent flavin oxidoreductase [Fusibacter sp. A1]RXV62920.1 NADH-dependent flavin oxidoreductase [Fusibacter sp. A1]